MTDIQDAAGNPLGAILAWGFTTQPPVTVILTVAKTETFDVLVKSRHTGENRCPVF
jgi:hypothetical protein